MLLVLGDELVARHQLACQTLATCVGGSSHRGWFQTTRFRSTQNGNQHCYNTDTTCNMFVETTPFEPPPHASPKTLAVMLEATDGGTEGWLDGWTGVQVGVCNRVPLCQLFPVNVLDRALASSESIFHTLRGGAKRVHTRCRRPKRIKLARDRRCIMPGVGVSTLRTSSFRSVPSDKAPWCMYGRASPTT